MSRTPVRYRSRADLAAALTAAVQGRNATPRYPPGFLPGRYFLPAGSGYHLEDCQPHLHCLVPLLRERVGDESGWYLDITEDDLCAPYAATSGTFTRVGPEFSDYTDSRILADLEQMCAGERAREARAGQRGHEYDNSPSTWGDG